MLIWAAVSESESAPSEDLVEEVSPAESPDEDLAGAAAVIDRRRPGRPEALPMDPWLFFAAIALSAIGLVMVYSAGSWLGHEVYGSWEFFLWRQAAFLAVGFILLITLSRVDYRMLRRFGPHVMFGALAMLFVVLFVGQEINGARRWIRFAGVGIQPSELAKLALAVFLAAT